MQNQQKVHSSDTISVMNKNDELDSVFIVSLIKEDEGRQNIWSYDFKESEYSPLFYEAICDDGLYLYRIIKQNQKISVVMLEDANIGETVDSIQGNTRQIQGERNAAKEMGQKYKIVTGKNTHVSHKISQDEIIRRNDLGQ